MSESAAPAESQRVLFSRVDALRTVLALIPSMLVTVSGNVVGGMALAVGAIPALQMGIAPKRQQRIVSAVLSCLFGLGIFLGHFLGLLDSIWVIGALFFAVSFVSAIVASQRRMGVMLLALVLPALSVGLSYDQQAAFNLMLAFGAGSLWTGLISLLWPESSEAASGAGLKVYVADDPREYGVYLGLAAATAVILGYYFDPTFIGWMATATLLTMRPFGDMVESRGFWRALATILGAILAVYTLQLDLPNIVTAALVMGVMVLAIGTRLSGWWLVPLATAFLILTLNLIDASDANEIVDTGWQRIADNVLGAGIALLYGLLLPSAVRRIRARSLAGS